MDAAQANATALEDAADPGLTIKDALDAYERHPNCPDAGEATVDQYRYQWGRFEKWLAKVRELAGTMTAGNWATVHAELLALAG